LPSPSSSALLLHLLFFVCADLVSHAYKVFDEIARRLMVDFLETGATHITLSKIGSDISKQNM
jgi:hypothetical protein